MKRQKPSQEIKPDPALDKPMTAKEAAKALSDQLDKVAEFFDEGYRKRRDWFDNKKWVKKK